MKFICRIARIAIWLLGISGAAAAQSGEIVRLRNSLGHPPAIRTPMPDSARVDILNRLAYAFYGINADSAFFYGRQALEYANRAGYPKGAAESWRLLGNTNEMIGNYGEMLSSYHHSLDIAEKIGNQDLIAKATSNIALFYQQEGDYDQARQLMEKVMDICRTSGDTAMEETVSAQLSDLAFRTGQYAQALEYAQRALQSARASGDESDIASCQNDFGRVLTATGEGRKALDLYQQALAYYRQVNGRLGMVTSSALLAEDYFRVKQYPLALNYATQALEGARALRRKPEIRQSAKALADIYEAQGDDRNALRYFKLYKDYSDSLFNDQAHKQVLALAASYDFKQKESRLREEQAEKDDHYQQMLRKDAVKISITVLVIAVLSLIAFILLRSRTVNRRINRLLREKNVKIEEQKEALEHQAVQLLLNNRQKDKLFSIISHDLRGPLNSLKGLMDLLKEKRLSEQEIGTMMHEFRRNVDYSSELVGNLLFWASSQLDGIVVTPVTIPLQSLVQDTLALFSHQAGQKNVSLKEDLIPSLLVIADKDMVQVIFRNLVSNAIKFCRSGDSVIVSYTIIPGLATGHAGSGVATVSAAAEIEICVADTGIGIKEEALEKIRRKESFTSYGTAKEKGTGLGMLLCREFTEANHGRFHIESEWGKGCRCCVSLPAANSYQDRANPDAPSSSSMRL